MENKKRKAKRLTHRRHVKAGEDYLASVDDEMKTVIACFGRCELKPWLAEPFDKLIQTIISQQLSTKAASTIVGRCYLHLNVESFTPEAILSSSVTKLRKSGLSHAKAEYCLGIAQAVENNELVLNHFHQQTPEEIKQSLIRLKGIGEWSAEMFLMFGLGYSDVLSYGDLGLRKGMQKLLKLDEIPSFEVFEQRAEVWKPYRTIASWYLWRLIENPDSI